MKSSRVLAIALAAILSAGGCARAPDGDAAAVREKKFEAMMAGVTLVGHSTRLNQDGLFGDEKYVIDKVSRLTGETWLIHARLQYGSCDLPVPVPVTIKWAGDTPVITLTDLTLPGLGTFTARVLLYGDQYAGTWSAKDHGGQLFGKIVHTH